MAPQVRALCCRVCIQLGSHAQRLLPCRRPRSRPLHPQRRRARPRVIGRRAPPNKLGDASHTRSSRSKAQEVKHTPPISPPTFLPTHLAHFSARQVGPLAGHRQWRRGCVWRPRRRGAHPPERHLSPRHQCPRSAEVAVVPSHAARQCTVPARARDPHPARKM